MKLLKKYEILLVLTEEFNENELKSWVFNYAKNLRKFNVCEISVISRGKLKFAYFINEKPKGHYIQLNFLSMPKYIKIFLLNLKINTKILRFLVLNK